TYCMLEAARRYGDEGRTDWPDPVRVASGCSASRRIRSDCKSENAGSRGLKRDRRHQRQNMTDRRHRRRIRESTHIHRSLSIIPSLFTIGNIFCGYFSIVSTLRGNWDYAAILIGIGYILDGLDGRIARLTKTTSDFGVQLDSIADIVTFGVSPAILAFNWGFGASEGLQGTVANDVHQLGFLATFAFVVCGALRLARFNVQ